MNFLLDQLSALRDGVPGWASTWLTPIWILCVGSAVGLAILLLLWGIVAIVRRPAAAGIPRAVREGPLWPVFIIVVLSSLFGGVGTIVVRKPGDLFASLGRFLSTGTQTQQFEILPTSKHDGGASDTGDDLVEPPGQKIRVSFRRSELQELELSSRTSLTVSAYKQLDAALGSKLPVSAEESFRWIRGKQSPWAFPEEQISALYVWNFDTEPATLTVKIRTAPVYAEMKAIPITAICVVLVFVLYFLQRVTMPKVSAIALATAKSEMARPLVPIVVALGLVLLLASMWIPYNTFGEDIKMLKASGLNLITMAALIVAFWSASTSVADEIDGHTALTVLSKPIGRRQFILGKFTGIVWVVAVVFIILGVFFLLPVAYKPIYDAREAANLPPQWQVCHLEMIRTVPGLALGFMEAVVLTALSVAISTRLPILANFVICSTIYVIGHLTPLIVKSSVVHQQFEPVIFIGRLLATVLPVLDHFNIEPAIAGGRPVPYDYLGMSLVYCILYGTVAMLLALVLFEDRDLA